MSKQNIAILGAGNLGLAIADGLVSSADNSDQQILITKRRVTGGEVVPDKLKLTTDNVRAVLDSDILIICVQPGQLKELFEQINHLLDKKRHTIVSTVTGVSISELEKMIDSEVAVIRAMPNTAVTVRQSMTCLSTNEKGKSRIDMVKEIFDRLGKSIIIEEDLMQASTVLCASGIAFWMRFIRATMQGGIQLGFHSADAQTITVQTCLGAASLLTDNEGHPELEIDRVTTPQGCTIAGLNEMEYHGLSSALIRGLITSYERITTMKKAYKKDE